MWLPRRCRDRREMDNIHSDCGRGMDVLTVWTVWREENRGWPLLLQCHSGGGGGGMRGFGFGTMCRHSCGGRTVTRPIIRSMCLPHAKAYLGPAPTCQTTHLFTVIMRRYPVSPAVHVSLRLAPSTAGLLFIITDSAFNSAAMPSDWLEDKVLMKSQRCKGKESLCFHRA